ncbi:MAG TPA: GAF domain-containing protein [Rectinemataceae bacterium]|nr:GAF domain-containing protein [Rectinemataceae bacterium]
MSRNTPALRWVEACAAAALVSLLGLLVPGDPAFVGLGFLPQILATVIIASLLGTGPGVAGCIVSAATSLGLAALAAGSFGLAAAELQHGRIPAAAALLGALAVGVQRDAMDSREKRMLERFRELVRRNGTLKETSEALVAVNGELETRVSGQRESMAVLYSRIRKMDSLDLDVLLAALLDVITVFAQAERAGVYEYDHEAKSLVLRASIGEPPPPTLPVAGSIEGWVFRNGSPFSLRMLDSYLNLSRIDEKRSILAYPLKAGELAWGVLNIQEMPFYRYGPATEKNLEIVISLAASYLKRAVDFRERVLQHPRNEVTGLPGFGELVRILGEELALRASLHASLSIVIIEVLDFEKIRFAYSGVKALGLVKSVAELGTKVGRALPFHYKEEGRLAFLLPDVDRDGASLFCLELMERIGTERWAIDGEAVRIETAFGLAAAAPGATAEALVAEAESLLTMSQGAFVARADEGADEVEDLDSP